jgi:hypothetical protein
MLLSSEAIIALISLLVTVTPTFFIIFKLVRRKTDRTTMRLSSNDLESHRDGPIQQLDGGHSLLSSRYAARFLSLQHNTRAIVRISSMYMFIDVLVAEVSINGGDSNDRRMFDPC